MEQNGDIIDMSRPVTVLERDTVYQGAVFSVEDMRLALHARDGGDIVVRRQVMRHAPCVVMLVHDTANDRYLMEREYRAGSDLFAYGLPAGLMDAGEEVMAAALRELREETGVVRMMPTPYTWTMLVPSIPRRACPTNWRTSWCCIWTAGTPCRVTWTPTNTYGPPG